MMGVLFDGYWNNHLLSWATYVLPAFEFVFGLALAIVHHRHTGKVCDEKGYMTYRLILNGSYPGYLQDLDAR